MLQRCIFTKLLFFFFFGKDDSFEGNLDSPMSNTTHANEEDAQVTDFKGVMDDRAEWYVTGWDWGTTMHWQGRQSVRLHGLRSKKEFEPINQTNPPRESV